MALAALSADLPPVLPLWPQLALSHVETALSETDRPLRLVVIGPAGSDKSPLLAQIADRLAALPHTRIIDDGHLLSDDESHALNASLDDPRAGLVLACRPWPWSPTLTALIRRIEQSHPALALGQVDTEDVLRALSAAGRSIDTGCVGAIVQMSASVTWLVKEALAAHGDGFCLDASHERVARAVGEVIALRLDTLDSDSARIVRLASLGNDDLPPTIDGRS